MRIHRTRMLMRTPVTACTESAIVEGRVPGIKKSKLKLFRMYSETIGKGESTIEMFKLGNEPNFEFSL